MKYEVSSTHLENTTSQRHYGPLNPLPQHHPLPHQRLSQQSHIQVFQFDVVGNCQRSRSPGRLSRGEAAGYVPDRCLSNMICRDAPSRYQQIIVRKLGPVGKRKAIS
jgi:hypothetical protein